MNAKAKKFLQVSLSVILLAVCVYYALKGIKLKELWDLIVGANYWWAILPIPIILASHWVRAIRWKRILKPIKQVKSTFDLFSSVMLGYAINCISPRAGEFVRPYALVRREKMSYSSALGTIVVERVIDVLALVFLLAATFIFQSEKVMKGLPMEFDTNKIIVLTLLIVGMFVLAFYPPIGRFFLKILIKPFSAKFYNKCEDLYDKFLAGFEIIKVPSEYVMMFVESMLIWLLYTLPMWIMFYSFSFEQVYHLGFEDAILLCVVSGVITTIAPTPGALGLYHVAIQNSMYAIYGIPPAEGLAYATLTHGINYLVQVVVGGLCFFHENVDGNLFIKQPEH